MSTWLAAGPDGSSLLALLNRCRSPLELELLHRLQTQLPHPTPLGLTDQQRRLVEQLLAAKSIRVALINDNGFYAGAGIATARQARSFALAGHQVSVIGLNPYPETALACQRYHHWLKGDGSTPGIRFHAARAASSTRDRSGARDHTALITKLLTEEDWDLVVLGNLHSDAISLQFLEPLLQRQIPLIWFAHDLDILGGGCGYPHYYACSNHLEGCSDANCPKPPAAYPHSANGRVELTYRQRSLLFTHLPVQVACHSRWSQQQLAERFPMRPVLRMPLGVDTRVFQPATDRAALRRRLGLDPDRFTVVVGADSIGRPGKGGEILEVLLPDLLTRPNLQVVCFGNYPKAHPHVVNCGYLDHEAEIAAVYASGDCFLNPVTIEAFGQTLLEASACGCVPVALRRGGVIDIVEHGRTGLLVEEPHELVAAVSRLQEHQELRTLLATEGRERMEQQFSLERQYGHWLDALCQHWATPTQQSIPASSVPTPAVPVSTPLISVVSTTLNCAEALTTTANSLAMQRYPALEWVVQDGGSSDDTAAVVAASGMPHHIHQESDTGIYDAANRAIHHCRGDWVLFLQAGDWLAGPDALCQVMAAVDHRAVDLIVADFIEILIDGTLVRRHPSNPAHKLQSLRSGHFQRPGPHWLSGMPSHQGLLVRRPWLERFPFCTNLRIAADWLQMFSLVDAGARVAMSQQLLSWYPNGGYSYDHSDQWMDDVITVAQRFQPDHAAVESYFAGAQQEHRLRCLQRRQRRLALRRWHP